MIFTGGPWNPTTLVTIHPGTPPPAADAHPLPPHPTNPAQQLHPAARRTSRQTALATRCFSAHKGAPESTGWKCNPLRATLPPFERLLTPVPKAWVFKAHRLQRHAAGNHVVEACVCELADTRRQAEGVADD